MTPAQIRDLTLYQLRLITEGYELTEKKSRYRRMNDTAKARAQRFAAIHGTF